MRAGAARTKSLLVSTSYTHKSLLGACPELAEGFGMTKKTGLLIDASTIKNCLQLAEQLNIPFTSVVQRFQGRWAVLKLMISLPGTKIDITLTIGHYGHMWIFSPNHLSTQERSLEKILRIVASADDIDFAYPTQRFYNNPNEGKPGRKKADG